MGSPRSDCGSGAQRAFRFLHHELALGVETEIHSFPNPHNRKSECRKNHHPSEGLQDTGESRNI
jgi:hypothetical protein